MAKIMLVRPNLGKLRFQDCDRNIRLFAIAPFIYFALHGNSCCPFTLFYLLDSALLFKTLPTITITPYCYILY